MAFARAPAGSLGRAKAGGLPMQASAAATEAAYTLSGRTAAPGLAHQFVAAPRICRSQWNRIERPSGSDQEFKAQATGECDVPGASVAKVAMSQGTNTNVLRGWRKLSRGGGRPQSLASQDLVPVAVEPRCLPPIAERDVEADSR